LACAFLGTSVSQARINVVTIPDRDSVQLTIYNSADLTLVKETRLLTLRKGMNRLEFAWANTLIDPTSVEFRPLTHADQVEVLDVSFPPRVTNTLEWRINSEFAGEVQAEIRYFTSGIHWMADYVAEADSAERLVKLSGFVRVTNLSGEDYENAQVRLVVGVVHLIDTIKDLALWGRPGEAGREGKKWDEVERAMNYRGGNAAGAAVAVTPSTAERPRDIVKEAISEYFLYTVEGRDTIPTGWTKKLPSFTARDVPITSYYKYEFHRWGRDAVRHYRFKNDTEAHLGKEPLPNGEVYAFRRVAAGDLYGFVGRTQVKYIPIKEEVELELGHDPEVRIKPTLMNWEKTDLRFDKEGNVTGWTTKETWQIELQNSKDIDVVLDIRRNFSGDWEVKSDAKYEKVDANKIKFVLPLKSREKRELSYELTTRNGINATR
jgi:hypothetical protein